MATTHSLATINGELSGDPIDLKMFLGTGWVSATKYGFPLPPLASPLILLSAPQTLEEPPPGSFDTLVPTVARPPGGYSGGVELAQLRQFTFSSELQRMSVMVSGPARRLDSHDPMSPCSHVPVFPFSGASGPMLRPSAAAPLLQGSPRDNQAALPARHW